MTRLSPVVREHAAVSAYVQATERKVCGVLFLIPEFVISCVVLLVRILRFPPKTEQLSFDIKSVDISYTIQFRVPTKGGKEDREGAERQGGALKSE